MAERTVDEWQKELEWAESTGNTEYANQVRQVLGTTQGPDKPVQAPQPSFLDNWGRPIAEAGGSLVGGAMGLPAGPAGIMAGAALGGHAAGMGHDYLTGAQAPAPQEQVMGAALNSMGGPTANVSKAPSMLRGRVPEGGLFDIRSGGAPQAIKNSADERAAELVEDAGGSWTAANRGSPIGQRLEGWSEASPFSVDLWTRKHESGVQALDDYIDEIYPDYMSRQSAGQRAAEGFQGQVREAERAIDGLYSTLDSLLERGGGRNAPIDMDALAKIADDYDAIVQQSGEFGELVFQDPDLKRAVDAIRSAQQSGQMPGYDVVKQLRTILGKKVGNNFGQTGEAVGQKRLYGALTEDLVAGREAIGGPLAAQVGRQADEGFGAFKARLKELEPFFGDKKISNPAQLYDAFESSLTANPTLARRVKEVLPEAEWNNLRDTYFNRISRAKPGAGDVTGDTASPATLVTNLAKMKQQSPESYKLLIEGNEEAMQVIERLAGGLKDSQKYLNRSNTAGALMGQQFGSELTTGLMGTAGALAFGRQPATAALAGLALAASRPILSRLTARALMSPTLNKALAKVGKSHDVLPVGSDLARALIAAGADKQEVTEIFGGDLFNGMD